MMDRGSRGGEPWRKWIGGWRERIDPRLALTPSAQARSWLLLAALVVFCGAGAVAIARLGQEPGDMHPGGRRGYGGGVAAGPLSAPSVRLAAASRLSSAASHRAAHHRAGAALRAPPGPTPPGGSPRAPPAGFGRPAHSEPVRSGRPEHFNDGLPAGVSVPSWALHRRGRVHFLGSLPLALANTPAGRGGEPAGARYAAGAPTSPEPRGQAPPEARRRDGPPPSDALTAAGSRASAVHAATRRCEAGYCPGVPLRYKGGEVQHNPVVHVILWGRNWSESPGAAVRTQLMNFYKGLSGSAWQGILTQYFDRTGYVSSSVTVTPPFTDTRLTAPTSVNDARLQEEIAYALGPDSGTGWARERGAQFVVLPAPGSTYESGFDRHFCAYHGVDSQGSSYTFLPYFGEEPFEKGCLVYDSDRAVGNVTTMLASHEYAESATDSEELGAGAAWQDAEGEELADICISGDDEIASGPLSGSWVQGLWDDHQSECSLADERPPHVLGLSEPASEVSEHEAILNATVNAENEGRQTSYRFEYGTTTLYGKSLPANEVGVGASFGNQRVHQSASALQLGVIYHYRLVASNSSGTTYGEDETVMPSQWSSATFANPNQLDGVSCWSSAACIAVGRKEAETWNGAHWSALGSLPYPGGPGEEEFDEPEGVAVDTGGHIWVADAGADRVDELSAGGEVLRQFGSKGAGTGQLDRPVGLAIAPDGDVWVADSANDRLEEFSPEGEYVAQSSGGDGQLTEPTGLAVGPNGDIWVADSRGYSVAEFSPGGDYVTRIGTFSHPEGVAVASNGDVWVADSRNSRAEELSPAGEVIRDFGWGVKNGKAEAQTCTTNCQYGIAGSGNGQLREPAGISVDASGNLWVVDSSNERVEEFSPAGEYIAQFGAGGGAPGFSGPWGIALSGSWAYVADSGNDRVQRWALPASKGAPPTYSTAFGEPPASEPRLDGVSCTAATACTAVGYGATGAGVLVPVADRWDGTEWSDQSISPPSGAKETLVTAVSCPSSVQCMAVGYSENSSGVQLPYAALWRNGSWSIQSTPDPPQAPDTRLDGVSCSSAVACMAVGQIGMSLEGPDVPFAESWNGSAWSIVPTKEPAGANKGELLSVSCTASDACTAVGDYKEGRWLSLAEMWNGSEWSLQPTPSPTGEATVEELVGVSCSTAESCTAVGSYEGSGGDISPALVETWNGVRWTIGDEYPDSILLGVSCVLPSACAAVGRTYTSGLSEALTLILRTPPNLPGSELTVPGASLGPPPSSLGGAAAGARALTRPTLSRVAETARTWREGGALARISAHRNAFPIGTTFSFALSAQASVTFDFARQTSGRRSGNSCLPQTARDRRAPRCTRAVDAGTLTLSARAGINKVRFEGLLSKHERLRPGSYVLQLTANAASGRSTPSALHFTIATR